MTKRKYFFEDKSLIVACMAKRLEQEYGCSNSWIGEIIADVWYALWNLEEGNEEAGGKT